MYISADQFEQALKTNEKALTDTALRNPEYSVDVDKFVTQFKMLDEHSRVSSGRGVALAYKKSYLVIMRIGFYILPAFITRTKSHCKIVMPNVSFVTPVYRVMEMFDHEVEKTKDEVLKFFEQHHLIYTCEHCKCGKEHGLCAKKTQQDKILGRLNIKVYVTSRHE